MSAAPEDDPARPGDSRDISPTEADLEMIMEAASGKPVKPPSLEAGITSMRQRIAELEASKRRMLERLDEQTEGFNQTVNTHIRDINRDLDEARQRLDSYMSQQKARN